jgi:hypothetical protein
MSTEKPEKPLSARRRERPATPEERMAALHRLVLAGAVDPNKVIPALEAEITRLKGPVT